MSLQITFLLSPNFDLPDYLGVLAKAALEKIGDRGGQISAFALDVERTSFTYLSSDDCVLLSQPDAELVLRPNSPLIYFPLYYEIEHLFGPKEGSVTETDEFLRAQWRVVAAFLEEFISAKMVSVNRPVAARRASNKITQMLAFAHLGLSSPDSLVTNCPKEARRFNRSPLVAKRLSEQPRISRDVFAFTMPFDVEEVSPDQYNGPPSLFQKQLSSAVEYRVFVFLDDIIAIQFDRSVITDVVDIHEMPDAYASAREVELAVSQKQDCIRLLRHFALDYAAIDLFIIEGRTVFLEVNPNGLWYWLPEPLANRVRDRYLELAYEKLFNLHW